MVVAADGLVVLDVVVVPFLPGTLMPTISSASRPSSVAAAALWWLLRAHSSLGLAGDAKLFGAVRAEPDHIECSKASRRPSCLIAVEHRGVAHARSPAGFGRMYGGLTTLPSAARTTS